SGHLSAADASFYRFSPSLLGTKTNDHVNVALDGQRYKLLAEEKMANPSSIPDEDLVVFNFLYNGLLSSFVENWFSHHRCVVFQSRFSFIE
ncbi:hypothetical protein CEXT_596191, partial [Caerostris extrusa]